MTQPAPRLNVLSDEAQHVVNALEAHFLAVERALAAGGPEWMKAHIESLGSAVRGAIAKFGGRFATDKPQQVESTEGEPEKTVET